MTIPILYTPEEISEKLKVTRRSVYEWLLKGKLRGLRAGDTWRISEADLMAFLESRKAPAPRVGPSQEQTGNEPLDSELVHGIRGAITRDQMQRIQSELPVSYELGTEFKLLVDPLATVSRLSITKVRAIVRLSNGWHMLNEARMALVEADACKLYYEELELKPTEASYWCRFYLDDAVLRLDSSCTHLLWAVINHFGLKLRDADEERKGLLVKVIDVAKLSDQQVVRREVSSILRKIRTSTSWSGCKAYRDKWVHSERPAIAGLDLAVSFGSMTQQEAEIFKKLGFPVNSEVKRVSVGLGNNVEVLRQNVRNSYVELHAAYGAIAQLLTQPLVKGRV